ncbi:unnamed protein product [Rotaria magnacalcarata]|uniref:Uncharacterized protein n=1 Tax=Rotaria magnacalcarata TaxID=392030 RepID=A0A816QNL7_9BILA|nr:unnamed protein product [Rotaria magnacalcarata]CAF1504545.1 unnamed protein product [Rotaria magnacalcarata]CAF2062369.1 unnamed protein product [Rotaria magnacalcarata]CAF2077698.1 unnamed protein product [Rotaria magnacalcarata]CAF3808745.1 unnamed protein product [Rotaria magnacalcarata]
MTNNKESIRRYSSDKSISRHNSISVKTKLLTPINLTFKKFHSNRNSATVAPFTTLKGREKQIYQSISNDPQHSNMINYVIPSTSPRTTNLPLENNNNTQTSKQCFQD